MSPNVDVHVVTNVGRLRLNVTLQTDAQRLVLLGPNGAGKSSFLSVLLGAWPVESGRISVGGDVLFDTERGIDIPLEERRLGYVPQDYALFPHLNVYENVAFALSSARPLQTRAERNIQVKSRLKEFHLEPHARSHPNTLSGGERQRVALARALAITPKALLLDEPLAALDIRSRNEIRAVLRAYLDSLALPTLLVTHDATDARELGEQIAVLEDGTITQLGTWQELSRHPRSRFIEEVVRSEASS
jgi:molybdate transport system ATP-binding protein